MRARGWLQVFVLLQVLALGCKKDKGDSETSSPDDSDPGTWKDTGVVEDTSPPPDTETPPDTDTDTDTAGGVDTSPIEDTSVIDTGDIIPLLADLELFPGGLAVEAGATWTLRTVAWSHEGLPSDADPTLVAFSSSDDTIATVDASGVVTSLAPGFATLSASYDGLVATVDVEVLADATVTLTLLDAETGLPVVNGSASLYDDDRTAASTDGVAILPTPGPTGIDVNAWAKGYVPVTLLGTVSRRITLALHPTATWETDAVSVSGAVDFAGVDSGSYSDVVVGMAGAAFNKNPLLVDGEELLGEDRTVVLYGASAAIPANLFMKSQVETYAAGAEAGDVGVWAFAGPIPITDVTAVINGDQDPVEAFTTNLPGFTYDWTGLVAAAAGDCLTLDVAPAAPFADLYEVTLPDLPVGFSATDNVLVLALAEVSTGVWSVIGLGSGQVVVPVPVTDPSALGGTGAIHVLAAAQVGGYGSGGAIVYATGPVEGGYALLGEFQTPPTLDYFSGSTHEYTLSSDTRSDLVRVVIGGGDDAFREVWLPAGSLEGTLTEPPVSFSYGKTSWTLTTYETTRDTFEGFISGTRLSEEDLQDDLITTARVRVSFSGS